MTGETIGVPSVSIMTTMFVDAASLMCQVLGAPAHQFAVIEHPISSASASGLAERARLAAADCTAILTGAITADN